MNIAMLCWLYLAARSRKPVCRVLCLLALLPLGFSIGLTASRTSIITAALVFGAAAAVGITAALAKNKRWLRWLAGCGALAVVAAASLWVLNAGVPLIMKDRTLLVESKLFIQTAVAEQESPAAANAAKNASAPKGDAQVKQRTFAQSFGTFSMRTEIWEAGVQYLKKNPKVLLFGSTDGQVSRIPRWTLNRNVSHMHNSWLEMLLQTGVLGFAAYVFIIGRMLLASARQVFNVRFPVWQRILAAAPVVMLVCTLMEIYPCVSGNVMDMMYMVLVGAVIGMDPKRKIRKPIIRF
jgi:O-antigen ligase